jgi:hypothetical protein
MRLAYHELEPIREIYLEDSWVLDVGADTAAVEFRIDFVLREQHPDYQAPKPNEQYCYRQGRLRFTSVRDVLWTRRGAPPARDATGEVDYGNIDHLEFDGDRYWLSGDWGEMELVSSEPPVVTFDT